MAAFDVLPVDLDTIDRRIKIAKGKAVHVTEQASQPRPRRRGQIKPKNIGYDEW